MIAKFACLVLALALMAGIGAAQPTPTEPVNKKLVTKVYNIKPLIGERGKASGVADADAVIKLLLETIPQLRELKPGTDGPQIVERDGGKLAIRAAAMAHDEIKDLLEALERLQDVAVDVKADVIEFDVATYEKLVKTLPKPKGKASPVVYATGEEIDERVAPDAAETKALAEVNKILRSGRVVQTSSGRFVNGMEATLAARLSVLTFQNQVNNKDAGALQFVKEGFKLVGLPVVSADRRFIRFKLTEHSVAVTRIKKVDVGEVVAKQHLILQSVETEDLGATGSAVIADGGTAIVRLAYAPKDKVWVVVLKPTLYIRAEDEEVQRQRLRKLFDLFLGR